jgi:two-component system nitrogen regulation response regulator NtrX
MSASSPPPSSASTSSGAPPAPKTVLVVDDEKNIRRTLQLVLEGEGYRVLNAETAEEGLRLLASPDIPVDVAVLDMKLPGMSGLEALERIRKDEALKDLPVVLISGHAMVNDAVNAIKLGASDFFEKPLSRERILVSVRNVVDAAAARRALAEVSAHELLKYEMIGRSAAMQRLFRDIEKVAPTKATVLITGESGTGKELISRAIHRLSLRGALGGVGSGARPFVKVNCAAIPRELIESELFGHERGAFTGAQTRKRGVFEQAHGGTLFLDEIGDMDIVAQAKVLRALQSGEVSRVGSEHVMHVDVRVLAATNRDLEKLARRQQFREDLLFRLNVFPIRSPALRERVDDIPLLAEAFLEGFFRENGMKPKPMDGDVVGALVKRRWPGNVRELKNVVERAAILAGERVTIADLPEDPHASPFDADTDTDTDAETGADSDTGASEGDGGDADATDADSAEDRAANTPPGAAAGVPFGVPPGHLTLRDYRDQAERRYIVDTLKMTGWNISRTAVVLGVERTNLHKKIRAYSIKRGET